MSSAGKKRSMGRSPYGGDVKYLIKLINSFAKKMAFNIQNSISPSVGNNVLV